MMEIKLLKDHKNYLAQKMTEKLFDEFRLQIQIIIQEYKDGLRLKEQLKNDLGDEIMSINKYLFEFRGFLEKYSNFSKLKSVKKMDVAFRNSDILYKKEVYPDAINNLDAYLKDVIKYYGELSESPDSKDIIKILSQSQLDLNKNSNKTEANYKDWREFAISKSILNTDGKTFILSNVAEEIYKLKLLFPGEIDITRDFIKKNFCYERKNKKTNEMEYVPYADSTIDKIIEGIKDLLRKNRPENRVSPMGLQKEDLSKEKVATTI